VSSRPTNARLEEYWDWFAVALFVLITVDMLTTMYAAAHAGPAAEANPFMRWAIGQGVLAMTAVNLAATVLAVGIFYGLMRLFEDAGQPWDRYAAVGVELWLGTLIAGGLWLAPTFEGWAVLETTSPSGGVQADLRKNLEHIRGIQGEA
jgi:hypothetical protein